MKIVDAFIFYNELDILYYRLSLLYDVVDHFILVEATRTFMGNPKPLYYKENEERFQKFRDKIVHIVVDDLNSNPDVNKKEQWMNEYHQRNCIDKGINVLSLDKDDIIVISDVDEIPKKNVITNMKYVKFYILALEQDFYYCNLTNICEDKWYASVIVKYEYYRINPKPSVYRNNPSLFDREKAYTSLNFIKDAGWHLSYFGDINMIKNKIKNYSHQENNIEKYIRDQDLLYRINNNMDLFDRSNVKFRYISLENNLNLPDNYDKYLKNLKPYKTVAFFVRQFSERGTEVAIYDYAHYNETLLGNKSLIIYLKYDSCQNLNIPIIKTSQKKFEKRFGRNMIEIDSISDMKYIIERYKIDFFYTLTHGGKDIYNFNNKSIWGGCKTIKHCNFNMWDKEGDYYLSVDESLNIKSNTNYPVIPHIIYLENVKEDMREELGIPKEALVFGRYGGFNEFNIEYVYEAIKRILDLRSDVYFLFMNTRVFYCHSNIIYLDKNLDTEYKAKFINTCDAMLHAREEGETFGLSIGEFSFMNKPVLTTPSQDNNAHINILGEQAIIYNNAFELMNILNNIKYIIRDKKFDKYKKYSPEYVMSLFNSIFQEKRS